MGRYILVALAILSARAGVVDRLVITVGQKVITEQQLDEELRVTAFLNHEKINRSVESRRAAADQLIQQLLVRREMDLSRYPSPQEQAVDQYFSELRGSFGTPAAFADALDHYDLSESVLKEHLALQLMTLQFIELRFRPGIGISESEIAAAYERQVAAWKANHPGATPPSLAASRDAVRKSLLETRTDEVLNGWLEESRKQVNIIYLEKDLQ